MLSDDGKQDSALVEISATIAIGDLAEQLLDVSDDAVLALIVRIDNMRADWDFTKRLHAYFAAECEKYEDEANMGEVSP